MNTNGKYFANFAGASVRNINAWMLLKYGRMHKPPTKGPDREHVAYLCLDSGIAALGHKGASVHLRSICRALEQAGCDVSLHCNRVGGELAETSTFSRQCIEHRIPNILKHVQRELRACYGPDLRIPAETRQAMINSSVRPQLVEIWRQDKPKFVLERLSLMGVAGLRASQELGICHILEVNALMSDEAQAFRSLTDYKSARRAEDEVLHGTSRIFCVSAELKRMIIARGVEEQRIQVLPNGYDNVLFRPRSGLAMRRTLKISDRFSIGMVGSLKPWHGVGLLLESMLSWSPRRKIALVIVGDGPESTSVTEFRENNPQLQVIQVGAVPHKDIPRYVAACDVCVAPYELNSSFYFSPLKVYEYMAMGKPVIASDQGQIRDVIQHGHTGFLFEPGNVEQFRAAVERLRRSPQLRQRIASNARRAVKGYTWAHNARQIRAVAKEICQ